MPKSLDLLKELLQEDKIDTKEALEALGFEIISLKEIDVEEGSVDYDEVIIIKKEFRWPI